MRGDGRAVVTASRSGADRALDVTDTDAVDALVAELAPATVMHLASALPGADAAELDRVNVGGTAAIAAACARHGARLVFASSAAVYGVRNSRASNEADAAAPANAYGTSKVRAEEALDVLGAELTAVSLRIFNVTGEGFPNALPSRLLRSTPDEPVALRNPDGFVRDYVHVSDVVQAFVAAADSEIGVGHLRINVGSGEPTSSRRLVTLIDRIRPVHVREEPGADDRVWADLARARSTLGLAPRREIDGGWFTRG
jgi:nucleoside-diphosphate-sugar epimerase